MYREKYTGVQRSVLGKKNLVFNELVFRTDADSQALKTYGFQMRHVGGRGDALGVWTGNAIKLGCEDHCKTINIIKFIE